MHGCDGMTVEEATLDQWQRCQFRVASHAARIASPSRRARVAPATAARRRTRPLYWCWLAGAALALLLYL